MASKITTLYISETNILLMVSRGKRINKLVDAPLDIKLADMSAEIREAELLTRLKRLFKMHKIDTKKVIVGLSGLHCLSRPVTLPQLPRTMLEEAMVREAKRVLPVPPEQLHISWQIIATIEGKMQAFMVAMPRPSADTVLGVLRQMGIKPYLMDIKPLALARLVPEPTAIIVDVQAREFDIVIMAEGIPQPIRTVPLAGEALSLVDKLSIVKEDLKRTIQFYNSNNPPKPIDSEVTMYVSGELADKPDLCEQTAKELGYRILPLISPLKCPKQLDPAHFLVNIGLALKELPKEAGPLLANINTMPTSYQPKPLSMTKLVALPAGAVAVGLIVLLVMTIQDAAASIGSVKSQLDSVNVVLEQKQAQKKELTTSITELEKKLASNKAASQVFITTLESIETQGDIINGDLTTTVDKLANGVELRSISHANSVLNIDGHSPNEAEVTNYVRRLDASERFSEITISNISAASGGSTEETKMGSDNITTDNWTGEMDFNLTLKLKVSE